MTHHAANDSHRIPHKPREKGAAWSAAQHDRRHKSMEGKAGLVGTGATLVGVTSQTTAGGGNPANYFPGIVSDAAGLRAYNSGGVITMNIDAATGSVTVNGTGVITGGTIQTSVSNPKVIFDSAGIRAINSGGATTLNIDGATGNITIGSQATITGGTIQTAAGSTSRVVMDGSGLRAYDASGNNTVNVDTTGALTVAKGSITLSSTIPAGTGARVTLDSTGIKGFNSSNTLQFQLDATSGLITAQGVITANAGSNIPTNVISGYLPAGANRYSNSAFQQGQQIFDTTGWTIGNGVAADGGTTAPPVYGARTLRLTANGAASAFISAATIADNYKRVLPGIGYTFSHYVYPVTTARQARVDINWYNSAGTLLSTTTGAATNTTLNTWTRICTTATAPAGAAYAIGIHYLGLSAANTEVFYTECYQMEEGDRVSAWQPRQDEVLINQINANNIIVGQLSDIQAVIGNLTTGSITSASISSSTITTTTMTLTGSLIQTSSGSVAKTAMDVNGFYVTDVAGTKIVNIDHINGLELTVGSNVQNQITWKALGVVTGEIYLTGSSLLFNNHSAGVSASVILTSAASSAGASVAASSGGNSLYVLLGDGTSSFPQLQGPARLQYLGQPAKFFRNAALAIASGGSQSMLPDATLYDPGGNMSAFGHKFYLCPATGYYLVSVQVQITTSAAAFFVAQIWRNGTTVSQGQQTPTNGVAGSIYGVSCVDIISATAGDTIEGAFSLGGVNATSLNVGGSARNYCTVQQVM